MRERCLRDEKRRGASGRAYLTAALLTLAGCSGVTENDALPPDVREPAESQTPDGAIAVYHGVRYRFREVLDPFVGSGATLTDELGSGQYGQPTFVRLTGLDRRLLPEETGTDQLYSSLHAVRGQATEAIGLLRTYAPDASPALQGHAYALAGYAEVLLADLYCSGIPLSTLDFQGDYTLRPGSTTTEVYEHAAELFDTAATLAVDSTRILHLAQVGKGRALLALGRYAEAGQAVAAVPDGFAYAVEYDADRRRSTIFAPSQAAGVTMSDGEGGNGLPYLSSGDPRVAAAYVGNNAWGYPTYRPAKYNEDRTSPVVLADWVEARLIEAEAALQADQPSVWLEKLNHLRRTAIVPALADTTDPVDPAARIDLLFRERAFWLFLTGHRQGDLRRLVREYGRDPETVYPSGVYPDGQGTFGTDVNLSVPRKERDLNPLYTGCLGREA